MSAGLLVWPGLEEPLWLLALPLVLLPWAAGWLPAMGCASLDAVVHDRASGHLERGLRWAGALALGGVILALAGPYLPAYPVERSGQGAEIVALLDRSISMDQPFGAKGKPLQLVPGGKILGYTRPMAADAPTKALVARQVLGEFAARRRSDRFGLVAFSVVPLHVLDFTDRQAAVQAAIGAGRKGRGLSETDIGAALMEGLSAFEGRAYTGSRILMLVSDGGDHLEPAMRDALARKMKEQRVSLYWLYLRSVANPGLKPGPDDAPGSEDTVPERALHRFFGSLGLPYKAYEVEDPDALRQAVADVDRLENLPITFVDTVGRRSLEGVCLAVAAVGVLLLWLAAWLAVDVPSRRVGGVGPAATRRIGAGRPS